MSKINRHSHIEVVVPAPPEAVWPVIADVTRIGEWSHECTSAKWISAPEQAKVGSRFRGRNRIGWMRWSQNCEFVSVDPPHQLSWVTLPSQIMPATTHWQFTLEPAEEGTRITQSYQVLHTNRFLNLVLPLLAPRHIDRGERLHGDLVRIGEAAAETAQAEAVEAVRAKLIPPLDAAETAQLAGTEYARITELLRSLDADDWDKATECTLWDVRDLAGHCVAVMSDYVSLRSVLRRMIPATRAARAHGTELVDEYTAMQVRELAPLSIVALIARAERDGPRAARWRAATPRLLRRMPMKQNVGGQPETWTMGYLFSTILTRDSWMHRGDLARATGRELVLTPEHDGRIVADVVAEWARRHGQPFRLTLTGPAGGEFLVGDGSGEHISMDAVEFCRILSGRGQGTGLLSQEVPF